MQCLPRKSPDSGFNVSSLPLTLRAIRDAERLGAIELAEILVNLLAPFVVLRHQVDPIPLAMMAVAMLPPRRAGEGDDEPGPELAIPGLSQVDATETNG